MSKKILHLSLDDKFTDMAIYYFEQLAPNNNEVIVYSKEKSLKRIKSCATIVSNQAEILSLNKIKYDLVVIHALDRVWFKLIKKFYKDMPIVWIGWGYDYYDLINQELFLDITKNISKDKKKFGLDLLRKLYARIFFPKKEKILSKINYFAPVLESEYHVLARKYRYFPSYIDFNYGSLERNFSLNKKNNHLIGDNILLGNSATKENNHLDAFDLIKLIRKNNEQSLIICPLSYGDEKYRNLIELKGRLEFSGDFQPLIEYLPVEEYINILRTCRIVIMNHIRQQAFGNIIIMLYMGANVFLREENPIYIFLKKIGVLVFSIQKLESGEDFEELLSPLSDIEIKKNQEILKGFIGEQEVLRKTSEIIALRNKTNFKS